MRAAVTTGDGKLPFREGEPYRADARVGRAADAGAQTQRSRARKEAAQSVIIWSTKTHTDEQTRDPTHRGHRVTYTHTHMPYTCRVPIEPGMWCGVGVRAAQQTRTRDVARTRW